MSIGKKLALFISTLFHPLFVPIYGMGYLWSQSSCFDGILTSEQMNQLLLVALGMMCLVPLLIVMGLKSMRYISGWQMQQRHERAVPLLVMVGAYLIATELLNGFNFPLVYLLVPMGGAFLILCLYAINRYWKISIHLAGVGGAVGVLLALSIKTDIHLFPVILVVLLSGLLVAFSRYLLKAHDIMQMVAGFLLGMMVMFTIYLIML